MKIDPSLQGRLPRVADPEPFTSPDGRARGWRVRVPGGRPLATPAVAGGRLFLGGGFGSYDFYALDAVTGRLAWQYQTADDGPTAAAVCGQYLAFSTESCELEVLTTDGRPAWKRWLGDPLMSMPALGGGRVFAAYPDSRGDRRHYLGCWDVVTGAPVWKQPIPGEVITAPVLADGRVHVTTLGGELHCFADGDGEPLWHEAKEATSSPTVWRGQCLFSQRREVSFKEAGSTQQTEYVSGRDSRAGAATHAYESSLTTADYLDHGKRLGGSPHYAAQTLCDAGVGFAGHKGDGKLDQAMRNLGHAHVSGVWAYQGSKPFVSRGRLFSALGDTLHCLDAATREPVWTRKLFDAPDGRPLLDTALTPPALVNGKAWVVTADGVVYGLDGRTGETVFRAEVGEAVAFQPAVAGGRVYVPTRTGSLVALETGDPADDGWMMWGGTPGHNGVPD